MSRIKSSALSSSVSSRVGKDPVSTWDTAIADAKKRIELAQVDIELLRQSIRIFKRLRDAGELFPGQRDSREK